MRNHALFAVLASSILAFAGCAGGTSGPEPVQAQDPTEEVGDAGRSAFGRDTDGGATRRDGSSNETPSDASGPVTIKNLSATGSSTKASLTFALVNGSKEPIDRIKEVTLKVGSKSISFPITCVDPDWLVSPGVASGVLDVTIGQATNGAGYMALETRPECAPVYEQGVVMLDGKLTLQIKGLLSDATPWTAEAETEL